MNIWVYRFFSRVFEFMLKKVFDISGKEITELVNKKQNSGEYKVLLNANSENISSGILFVSLEIDGVTIDSKKLVLIK